MEHLFVCGGLVLLEVYGDLFDLLSCDDPLLYEFFLLHEEFVSYLVVALVEHRQEIRENSNLRGPAFGQTKDFLGDFPEELKYRDVLPKNQDSGYEMSSHIHLGDRLRRDFEVVIVWQLLVVIS